LSKFDIRFCLGPVFCDIRPIRNHQLIGFTPIDEQVKISQEVRVMFKYFVIVRGLNLVWSTQPSSVMLIAKISFLIWLRRSPLCISVYKAWRTGSFTL